MPKEDSLQGLKDRMEAWLRQAVELMHVALERQLRPRMWCTGGPF